MLGVQFTTGYHAKRPNKAIPNKLPVSDLQTNASTNARYNVQKAGNSMTLTEVIARITARGMQVTEDKVSGNVHLLTVSKDGVNIPWPTITVSSKGGVSDVGLPSFHGGKVTGLGDYPTAAIYADVYLAHAGRPAQAEKALAAMLQPVTQVTEQAQAA